MRKATRVVMLLALGALVALQGCGGNDGAAAPGGGATGVTVDGAVIKGPVNGSQVCAYRLDAGVKGAQIALSLATGATGTISGNCYVTPADGSYRFTLPSGMAADVMIEATGGTFCADEAPVTGTTCTGGAQPLSLGTNVLTAVLAVPASGTATVYTTPLTTAAVAAAGSGNLSATAFNASFVTLAGQVIGANSGVTPSTAPTLTQQPYLVQVSQFIQSGGSLSAAVTGLTQGTTNFQASPTGTTPSTPGTTTPGNVTAATLNSALVGTYNLVFHKDDGPGCGTRCNYTDGQAVTFTVQASGALVLPNGTTLANPFYRVFGTAPNLAEIIWLDTAANVEYALTNNTTGVFNEINVGDAAAADQFGIPGFLGQARKPQPTGPASLVALAGTYSNALQYAGSHLFGQWSSVTIGLDGSVLFEGAGNLPNISADQVTSVVPCINVCGFVRINVSRDVNGNGQSGDDSIVLHVDTAGALRAIAWETTANIIGSAVGIRVVPENSTLPALTHSGAAVAQGVISGTLDGSVMTQNAVAVGSPNASSVTLDGKDSSTFVGWRLQFNGSQNLNTDFGCLVTPTLTRSITVTLPNSTQLSTVNGGRCSIRVTNRIESGGSITHIEGTFVAELLPTDRQNVAPKTVLNGTFSWSASVAN